MLLVACKEYLYIWNMYHTVSYLYVASGMLISLYMKYVPCSIIPVCH